MSFDLNQTAAEKGWPWNTRRFFSTAWRRLFPQHRRGRVNVATRLPKVRQLARLMDEAVRIPGTRRRIGLDSLIGLIPGIGDLLTTGVSAYIIREAWLLGLPKRKLVGMTSNVVLDTVLGAIPLLGDVFDFAYKSNSRNVRIIEDHLQIGQRTVDGKVLARKQGQESRGVDPAND